MAQALASLHAAAPLALSLEFGRHAHTVGLYCRGRGAWARQIETQLAAAYPDVSLRQVSETALQPPQGASVQRIELWLAGDVLTIGTCDEFEDRLSRELNDPLAGLLGVLAAEGVWSHVAIEAIPAASRRVGAARSICDRFQEIARQDRSQSRRFLMQATSPHVATGCWPVSLRGLLDIEKRIRSYPNPCPMES